MNFKVLKSISVMSIFTFLSRIIGYIRDLVFAYVFGATNAADSFLLAFRLPSFFRRLFAEGAINNAFIPLYLSVKKQKGKIEGDLFVGNFLAILFILLLFITLVCELFMFQIISFLAPGFSEEQILKTKFIASIMFPYLIFISLSSLLGALLNANNRYALWSFSPIILNLMMVFSMLFAFYKSMVAEHILSFAVIGAGVIQIAVLYFWVRKIGINIFFISPRNTKEIKKLFSLLLPNILAGGVVQINQFVGVIFASTISGAISWLYYADRVVQLPLGIFIISISTVMLTYLSKNKISNKNNIIKDKINSYFILIMGITFLCTIGLIALSDLIVDVLFKRGRFGYGDLRATSDAILMYSLGLPAFGLIKFFSVLFFSKQNTKIPFYISLFSMFINIFLVFILFKYHGHLGIALSLSIASWINAVILYIFLVRYKYWTISKKIFYQLIKLFIISIVTYMITSIAYFLNIYHDFLVLSDIFEKITFLVILIIIAILSFLLLSFVTRLLVFKNIKKLYLEGF